MNIDADAHDSRAELFEAISHPTRIKILQVLSAEPMGFADLKRATGIESSGNMSFHLAKLRNLVRVSSNGDYVLTDDGKEALWSIGTITGTMKESGGGLQVRRSERFRIGPWTKPLVVGLLILVIVLASISVIQQGRVESQQRQIGSQQGQIGLYVNQANQFVDGQNASLVLGQSGFNSYAGATSVEGMIGPTYALFDSRGNLWVVDSGNSRILEFNAPFTNGMSAALVIGQKNFTAGGQSAAVYGLGNNWRGSPSTAAFDSFGNLWVADSGNNRILEYETPLASGMSASVVIGQEGSSTSCCTDSSVGRSGLSDPTRSAFDSHGNLWVMDAGNNRVLEFKPPFASGMDASLVIGQKNFEENITSTSRSGLYSAEGDLAIDSSGNLWVGDAGNSRILEFKPPFSDGMNASIVVGQSNFTSRGHPLLTLSGVFPYFLPSGGANLGFRLAFDHSGNLWTTSNDRLFGYEPPYTTNMQASMEIGQRDFTSHTRAGGQNGLSAGNESGLCGVNGISFDSAGNMWVADCGNNRVLEFVSGYAALNTANSLNQVAQPSEELLPITGGMTMAVVGGVITLALLRRQRSQKR